MSAEQPDTEMAPAPPPPAETEPSRDNEATPTPAPAPAAADENVAPGPRATRLRALYGQALQHTLGKLAWENFAACYPTISSRSEGVLRQVQGQMVGKLGEKCQVSRSTLLPLGLRNRTRS
jgi:kinetochore protein NNF1